MARSCTVNILSFCNLLGERECGEAKGGGPRSQQDGIQLGEQAQLPILPPWAPVEADQFHLAGLRLSQPGG